MYNNHSNYEIIRKDLNNRWRRRFLWVAHLAVFGMAIVLIWFLPRHIDPYGNFRAALLLGLMGTVSLHFVYLVFAELRDRALRKAIEKERRWELLERLVAKGEDQPTLAHLLLEEDDELLDEFHRLQDEPKRKNR